MTDTAGPARMEVLVALANADALPIKTELDFYTIEADKYRRAVETLNERGWLPPLDRVRREELSSGTYEAFEVAGVEFVSPRGYTPLTEPTTIEKLAAGPIVLRIGSVEVEIEGEGAEIIRNAALDATRRPLPSSDASSDANVVPLHGDGRGRQVAPLGEGA